jgi:hypothetical protein
MRPSNRRGSRSLRHGCPSLQAESKQVESRLWDLLPVVRNRVYHPMFAGSYSLKAVLPALVPQMSYAEMQVANGRDAGLAWESLVGGSLDGVERDRVEKALLEYCGQDTLALIKLLQKCDVRSKRLLKPPTPGQLG